MHSIKKQVWALNQIIDQTTPKKRLLIVLGLLFVFPLLIIGLLGLSFEDERAQLVWLVWTLWALAPRLWYCHKSGKHPWRKQGPDS